MIVNLHVDTHDISLDVQQNLLYEDMDITHRSSAFQLLSQSYLQSPGSTLFQPSGFARSASKDPPTGIYSLLGESAPLSAVHSPISSWWTNWTAGLAPSIDGLRPSKSLIPHAKSHAHLPTRILASSSSRRPPCPPPSVPAPPQPGQPASQPASHPLDHRPYPPNNRNSLLLRRC